MCIQIIPCTVSLLSSSSRTSFGGVVNDEMKEKNDVWKVLGVVAAVVILLLVHFVLAVVLTIVTMKGIPGDDYDDDAVSNGDGNDDSGHCGHYRC